MHYAKGLCNKHWSKLRQYGDPRAGHEHRNKLLGEVIGIGVTRCPKDPENDRT